MMGIPGILTKSVAARSRAGRALECGLRGLLGFGLGGGLVALGGFLPKPWSYASIVPAMAACGYLGGTLLGAFTKSRRWTIAAGVAFAMIFGLVSQGVSLALGMFRPGEGPGLWAAVWGISLAVAGLIGGIVIGRPFLRHDAGMLSLLGPGMAGAFAFGPLALLAGQSGFASYAAAPAWPFHLLGLALTLGGAIFGALLGLISSSEPTSP